MATVHQTWDPQTIATVLSTQLNALGAGAASAVGVEVDNSALLLMRALFELNVTFAVAPTAFTTVDLFLIPAPDGTNYDDGSATVLPQNFVVGSFSMRAVATAQKLSLWGIELPPTKFKMIAFNNTDQAFSASGHTVKAITYGLKAA